MEDELVTLETAKLLKDCGFDGYCYYMYMDFPRFKITEIERSNKQELQYDWHLCPTQSLAARWLREKHGVFVLPWIKYADNKWECAVVDIDLNILVVAECNLFKTYELSLEEGLQKALEFLKKNLTK